jgi:hypothetical protein
VIASLLAEGGGVDMDAADVFVGIDRGAVAGHQPAEAAFIGDDGAAELGALAQLFKPLRGFGSSGPGKVCVLVAVNHREKLFAPGESLFGFDFGAESRIRHSRIAFEHLDAQVSVGDCSGDGASGAAGDEPRERAPFVGRVRVRISSCRV